MPSYLIPYQPVQIQPYESPLGLYQQALQYKNFKFAQGLSNIRSHYDAVLNTPLTNEQDQQVVRDGIDTAMQKLSKAAVSDLSLPENQAEINGVFDSILNDNDIMYDAAWTRRHNREIRKAEDLQKKDPSLVPPQNLEPLYLASENFRTAAKGSRPGPTKFTPYYDFDKKMTEALDKVKPDVDVMFNQKNIKVEGPDGQMHDITVGGQYTVEQLKEYTINKIAMQRLSADPQALQQMKFDYDYNTRNGLYPPSAALEGIQRDIEFYRSADKAIQTALDSGTNLNGQPLTDNERTLYKEQKKTIEADSNRLLDLNNKIKLDPTASNEWFTFNKHVKDYVGGKVDTYAYTKNGLLSDIPGANELNKYRYDVWLRQWDSKYDKELEDYKAKTKAATEASGFVEAPIIGLYTKLDSSTEGIHLDPEDGEIEVLGGFHKDEKGRLWKDWTGLGANPAETVIAVPGNNNFTKQQRDTIESGTVLRLMYRDLESLGFEQEVSTETSNYVGGLAPTGGGTTKVKIGGQKILEQYYADPKSGDPKVKAILDKYQPILGIDLSNKTQISSIEDELKDPTIAGAVDFGMTWKPTGRHEFVPATGNNVVLGRQNNMLMRGFLKIPESEMGRTVGGKKSINDGLSKGYILNWNPAVSTGEEGSKVEKTNEKMYLVSAYIPVTGDVEKMNDRLLETKDYFKQLGQKAPEYREASRQKVGSFMNQVRVAEEIPTGAGVIQQTRDGKFELPNWSQVSSSGQAQSYSQVLGYANELSTRTGIPYNEALNELVNVLGVAKTPLQRQLGINNYLSNVGSGAISLDTPAARNNNPFNLKDGDLGGISPTGKDNQGHAIYGSIGEGLGAGLAKLQLAMSGQSNKYKPTQTIEEFSKIYAESPNDAKNLVNSIQSLGYNATASTKIGQIPLRILYEAMIMKEDRRYYNYLKNSKILDSFLNQVQ